MHKKILIVSHNALSLHWNNGKTLHALFNDWPYSDLAQLYFDDEIPQSTKFENFFRVRDLDVLKYIISFGFIGLCGGKILPERKVVSHYKNAGRAKTAIIDYLRSVNTLKLLLRDIIYGTGLWQTSELFSWITGFKPDSIFFVGGNSLFSFKIAKKLSTIYGIPLDVYITDDYVINPKPKGCVARILQQRLFSEYNSTFRIARNVFVIGDDMAEAFQQAFDRKFIPIMNLVSISESLPKKIYPAENTGTVNIVYAGGLHLGRDDTLVMFGQLLRIISNKLQMMVRLTVYSLQEPSKIHNKKFRELGVVFAGALDQKELEEKFSEADFLLHVESFDEKYISLTALSVSTKIPEYLASGTCMICYGPSSIASVRLIEKNNLGICLTDNDSFKIMERKISEIIMNADLRKTFAKRAFEFAKLKFDVCKSRYEFRSILNK